ncbi:MAG TPA: hypothetical protein VGJ05_02845 [Fimbriiglobus sp.]|jgi:hypothetical protein
MDEAMFTIKPYKSPVEEKTGVRPPPKEQLRCVIVVPKTPAAGSPWSWRGYYFDHEPQTEVELLNRGFHVGFVLADAGKAWDVWYTFLSDECFDS